MSLPPGNRDTRQGFEDLVKIRSSILQYTLAAKNEVASGSSKPSFWISYHNFLMTVAPLWDDLATVPGLEQYVKDRIGDQSYDVAAAYAAVETAGANVVTFIRNNLPNGASGYAQWTLSGGKFEVITFTSAQLNSVVSLLDALIAATE